MIRTIIHIDMDAFYASVEQRDHPAFKGKPVIVGADPKGGKGRGVVCAASYEARKFGIHSAQPISRAFRLCPKGIFIPVNGKRYVEVSQRIMSIFQDYTPLVEPISLDEAFLDVSGTERLKGEPEKIGHEIKQRILSLEKLTASVGIGPNKLIAKIASDLDKPDGFVSVHPEDVPNFLDPLQIRRLWGVGKKSEEKMHALGIKTIGDLAKISKKDMRQLFGNIGIDLWHRAQGIDHSPVMPYTEAKSISNEVTFSNDMEDSDVIRNTILQLSDKVGYRLRKSGQKGKTVFLKVRIADFTTSIRNHTLAEPVQLSEVIFREAMKLFARVNLKDQPVRLVGVGVTQLSDESHSQTNLFKSDQGKREKVTDAVDLLKKKYGSGVIGRGLVSGES